MKHSWSVSLFLIAALLALTTAPALLHAQTSVGASSPPALSFEAAQPSIDLTELELRVIPMTRDELAELANVWFQAVKAATTQVVEAQLAVRKSKGDAEKEARKRLTELQTHRGHLFMKYVVVLNAWEKKAGDEKAIAEQRAYWRAVAVAEAQKSDFRNIVDRFLSWLTDWDGGLHLLVKLGVVLLSIGGLLAFAQLVQRYARYWIERLPNLSRLRQTFLVKIIYWFVFVVGSLLVIAAAGIDISPIFALIGGASFILAFAFQDTLGNLASGLMIMINHPFDEGDYVDIGGVAGTVRAVNMVATTVTTPDNQVNRRGPYRPRCAIWRGTGVERAMRQLAGDEFRPMATAAPHERQAALGSEISDGDGGRHGLSLIDWRLRRKFPLLAAYP